MATTNMRTGERRSKWAVLNVTPTERAAIIAAAKAEGLSINAFILARLHRRPGANPMHRAAIVRHLARIEHRLDQIAQMAMTGAHPAETTARVLLALWQIERAMQASWDQGQGARPGGDGRFQDDADMAGTEQGAVGKGPAC